MEREQLRLQIEEPTKKKSSKPKRLWITLVMAELWRACAGSLAGAEVASPAWLENSRIGNPQIKSDRTGPTWPSAQSANEAADSNQPPGCCQTPSMHARGRPRMT